MVFGHSISNSRGEVTFENIQVDTPWHLAISNFRNLYSSEHLKNIFWAVPIYSNGIESESPGSSSKSDQPQNEGEPEIQASKCEVIENSFVKKRGSHNGHAWRGLSSCSECLSPALVSPKEWKHFFIFLKCAAAMSTSSNHIAGWLSTAAGQTPWELHFALCMAL